MTIDGVHVRVRFFAGLRERLGREEQHVRLPVGASVAEVWDRVSDGESMPENLLIALNMEYVQPGAAVHENDEVAFFPPVTGG